MVEHEALERWARRLGLRPEDKAFIKLQRSRFASLVARAHPRADLDNLSPVVDFLYFIFLWDDQFDCRIGGELPSPSALGMTNMLASMVLQGAEPNEDSSPLLWTLSELRSWLAQHMSQEWMDRFCQSFQDYFDSTVWELEQRHQGVCPDLETYIRMRRLTSGGYWVTHLIEVAEGLRISDETWNHPALQELLNTTANIIGWANDLLSLRSELDDSGHLNLVFSLQQEFGLSLQDAIN
jgi:5-epi-alpha-selinene synthase